MDFTQRLSTALVERYHIKRQLGQGGMALVFLAQDVRHDRRVALKLLRPELMALLGAERFLNEIKVTANLQHPHILPLHDSGEADGLVFYVMPYIEGESLRDKLTREKQLDIDEAISIARLVASALDYAHRHGVIHRDIKPENVLMHDGQPVVSDFGIALAVSAAGGSRITETGLSLGTPHYMSPEQAMGDRVLDARSDIYSLAAVVYELLAGEPPYTGPTAQAIVARVITEKPISVTAHRDTVPPHVAAAIQKALSKLPADRFHSAAEFAEALVRPVTVPVTLGATAATAAGLPLWRDRRVLALAGATTLAAGIALWGWLRPEEARPVLRFAVSFPKGQEISTGVVGVSFAVSPDGTRLVYTGSGTGGQPQLLLRSLDQINAAPLPISERVINPTFSPDGQSVVFSAPVGILKVVSLAGGPPIVLTDSAVPAVQASWGSDGWVYYGRATGLWRVRASGGPSQPVGMQDSTSLGQYRWVDALPNGRGAVLTEWHGNVNEADIGVMDFRTGTVRTLLRGAYSRYLRSGHLIIVRADGVLVAAPFDQDRLAITGPATPLLEGIVVKPGGAAELAVSGNGTLLYMSGAAEMQELVWVTRNGTEQAIDPTLRRHFGSLALSPDNTHLVVSVTAEASRTIDLWVYELKQGTLSRLTSDGQLNDRPTWTPDGRRITFISDRKGGRALYTEPWDGSGPVESLLTTSRLLQEAEWSRDGRFLVYRDGPGGRTGRDILYLRPGVDSAPHPFVATEFDEASPALSPDGRWLAYISDETGRNQVYVRPFPGSGGRWQISTDGGTEPLWAPDGRGIYYRTPASELMRAEVQTRPTFAVGGRRRLFSTAAYVGSPVARMYALSADGSRFLFMKGETGARQLVVVVNWFEELKHRISGGSR